MSARISILALFALLSACDPDGSAPGVRGPCASPAGAPLGCERIPIESAEDACDKLVDCGAIPIANPEDEPNCCLDYWRCVSFLERMSQGDLDLALACVEGATCDQLLWNGSPDRPSDARHNMPPCLVHGDQR